VQVRPENGDDREDRENRDSGDARTSIAHALQNAVKEDDKEELKEVIEEALNFFDLFVVGFVALIEDRNTRHALVATV